MSHLLKLLLIGFVFSPLPALASGKDARQAYLAGKHLLALELARPAAEQGDSTAMLTLGSLYFGGAGVRQDYAAALKWWRASAALGDRRAQQNLGILFRDGLGVERNLDEAVKWFELAASNGEALAHWNLGLLHENGEGFAKDTRRSIILYQKAIELYNVELEHEPSKRRAIESYIQQLTWRTQWLSSLLQQERSSAP